AQIEEARRAMDRSDNVGAVRILSDALANNPTADVYLTLGTVYGRMKDFQREEDILKEGAQRYPQDPRFHNQLADLALENNDRETAKIELHRALDRDPNNSYASDLLATIDMSEGEVQSALRSWNRSGRPSSTTFFIIITLRSVPGSSATPSHSIPAACCGIP